MLDSETQVLLAAMPRAKRLDEMTPAEARSVGARLAQTRPPGPRMARVRDFKVRSCDGAMVTLRMFKPAGAIRGLLVYAHGGGWTLGSIAEIDTLARLLAVETGTAVVLVEYRLAPEHPHPSAVEDVWAAVCWAASEGREQLGFRAPVLIAGDSAGGNLAAAVARCARSADLELALQVLIYPVLACDFNTPTYLDPDNQLVLDRDAMIWLWDQYAPSYRRGEPAACPGAAFDMNGLCPAVIVLAEHDILRDEGERYAWPLRAADVPVALQVFTGQMHMFFTFVDVLPASAEARRFICEGIDRVLGAAETGSVRSRASAPAQRS